MTEYSRGRKYLCSTWLLSTKGWKRTKHMTQFVYKCGFQILHLLFLCLDVKMCNAACIINHLCNIFLCFQKYAYERRTPLVGCYKWYCVGIIQEYRWSATFSSKRYSNWCQKELYNSFTVLVCHLLTWSKCLWALSQPATREQFRCFSSCRPTLCTKVRTNLVLNENL